MKLIVCCDSNYGIGKGEKMPWNCPEDMKHFSATTKGHPVVMGRKTADSIPRKYFPLKDRLNVVVTSNPDLLSEAATGISYNKDGHIIYVHHPMAVIGLDKVKILDERETFCIGGATLYGYYLKESLIEEIYLTKLPFSYDCDTFFPFQYLKGFHPVEIKMLTNREEDNVFFTLYKKEKK